MYNTPALNKITEKIFNRIYNRLSACSDPSNVRVRLVILGADKKTVFDMMEVNCDINSIFASPTLIHPDYAKFIYDNLLDGYKLSVEFV